MVKRWLLIWLVMPSVCCAAFWHRKPKTVLEQLPAYAQSVVFKARCHILHQCTTENLALTARFLSHQRQIDFDLSGNNLTGEQLPLVLFNGLFKNIPLDIHLLKLQGCNLFNVQLPRVRQLVDAITAWRVVELDIQGNYLRFMPTDRLAVLMQGIGRSVLESLNVSDNGIKRFSPKMHEIFWQGLNHAYSLKKLDLSRNNLCSGGAIDQMPLGVWQILLRGLVLVPNLAELNLAENNLYAAGVQLGDIWAAFTCALIDMQALKVLDLRDNHLERISYECRALLADSLIKNRNHPTLIIDEAADPVGYWRDFNNKGLLNVRIV